eukprot:CAMPEP_0173389550 /NCGR_PEP_ID=MMETSP1356-20130122/12542_1 /TAXON_ID=77927 ORGANISM="Hemiselmis virescens, Strain PCC157" /NCGR_SAMPLE_ID=MMETSP1356 /ASSEMBLY_ACC=CAM_ASM_000847 /LENGTH=59 /DNA_ID=CAMNT_0014346749 /DNA_START=18 /DNA_END=197 /DNA_ORIENTATION=-
MFEILAHHKEHKEFKADWNKRFGWFTQGQCSHITTIRGEKDSRTATCGGFDLKHKGSTF